ncbi:TniQ protein [Paraburkholderia sp. BL23I1N1]|uniref:TnsD family Tn7-like transposition protein n=1 Tax=Paraburkholderia sp. BL23I1N1 TaxID=1938802 RepID=UPI000FEEC121|nr:TnsD family Tn7-like transposition protein [Paraburkholderia sp. BL23I1N1]RKE25183.1 TniQ protein [Paraburkholderia sp. BL23I1N1]
MSEYLPSRVLITPFPDGETVNSLLRRTADFAGDSTLRKISRQLLTRGIGLDGMPSRLDEFQARIGYLFGDRNELEAKHTLLAYELLGVPKERQSEQKRRLRAPCKGPIRSSRLPVLLAPSERAFFLCPECAEEAQDQHGFSFTHRRNVAPFVAACPVHFCWLRTSLTQEPLFDAQCHCARSAVKLRNAIEFAKRSDTCVAGMEAATEYGKSGVIDALRDARWLMNSGRLRLSELISTFEAFYRESFDDSRLDTLVSTPDYVDAALRTLMRDHRAIHPVWCILLRWFSQHCECPHPSGADRTHRDVKCFSVDQARAALLQHGTVVSAANELGTSAHALTILCRCSGIPIDARPSKLADATLANIQRLLVTGMRPQDIALATGMSTSSVYRVLAAMPSVESHYRTYLTRSTDETKSLWLKLRREHPDATQTQLRDLAPAAFALLRRNAPEWLKRQRRTKQTKHSTAPASRPHAGLSALARAIDAAESHLVSLEGPPMRRSAYRLRELLGISEYALTSSLPSIATQAFSQTRDGYIAARVEWGTRQGASARVGHWRMARAVKLRQTTLKNWEARRQDEAQTVKDEHGKFVSRDRYQA